MWGFFFFYRMKILSLNRLNWAIQPLSRILLLFFLGLLYAYYLSPSFYIIISALIIVLGVFLYFYIKPITTNIDNWILSILVLLTGCFVGNRYNIESPVLKNIQLYQKQFYLVRITSEFSLKDSSLSFDGDYFLLNNTSTSLETIEPVKVRSTIFKNAKVQPKIGQLLIVYSRLAYPQEPILPGAFDYRSYLKRRNIQFTSRFSNQDFLDLHSIDFSVRQLFIDFRNRLIGSLENSGLKDDQLSIASALLLGARSEISEELNVAYSQSGITHILAVSGMHVGLVFLALGFLLKRIQNKLYVCLLSLVFLWGYACLTGLSPSVVRAAWMFSFIACGKLFRSGHQKWNSIAASALLMLVLDPFIWLDAGFQLSFFAVWGIVALGKLPEKFITKYKWINYSFEAAWISCVAQLCTLPISLYIFGKFPVYFLLANIFAVPISTILTYWGILCFIVLPIPFLANYTCLVLGYGIDIMNFIATTVARLPASTFDNIFLNLFQSVWIAFVIYFSAAQFLSIKQKIKSILSLTLIFSFLSWTNFFLNCRSLKLIYYSAEKFAIIDSRKGVANKYVIFGDAACEDKTVKSFETFLNNASIKLRVITQTRGNLNSKSFILKSDIDHFKLILFIHPDDNISNPFERGIFEIPFDYVILFNGGNSRFRRYWRLATMRKRIPLIELKQSKMIFQNLSTDK